MAREIRPMTDHNTTEPNTGNNTVSHVKIEITETARNTPAGESHRFSDMITETFKDMDGIRDYLMDRYGRIPGGRNKIYVDTNDGVKEVGFLYSYWNKDCSHNSKSWFQTDWVSISEVTETPRLLRTS